MAVTLKVRSSYHTDAAHLLKLADAINRDPDVDAEKKAKAVEGLNGLATQLLTLKSVRTVVARKTA